MKKYLFLALSIILFCLSCKKDESKRDTIAPTLTSTTPADGATRISTSSPVFIGYSENIILDNAYQILVNGESKSASISGNTLTIDVQLLAGTKYEISISATSVKDIDGNYADAVSFSFTTKAAPPVNGKYEAENAEFSSSNSVMTNILGYSGTGYIGGFQNTVD